MEGFTITRARGGRVILAPATGTDDRVLLPSFERLVPEGPPLPPDEPVVPEK
jgi:hypothetical protein